MRGWNFLNKILIVYTNSGAGHRRAAEALYQGCAQVFPKASVQLIDILDYTTPVFQRAYPQTYLFMVNRLSWFWGFGYYFLDLRGIAKLARLFRRATNGRHCKRFETLIRTEQPDLVLTTHWLPNEIISFLKKKRGLETKLVTCITDYYPHAFWRDAGVDLYITASADLTPRLNRLGIANEKIMAGGIPIDPVFNQAVDQKELREQLELNPEQFTVLVASGGFGIGPMEKMVRELLKIEFPLQVRVVCGNNLKLQTVLSQLAVGVGMERRFRIYGFVRNMHELMGAADLIITKSGGLTTTEAIAKNLPMVILYPIPGQESNNCEFVTQHGGGVRAKHAEGAKAVVEGLLNHPQQLEQMRHNLKKIGRPDATLQVLQYIEERFFQEGGRDGIKASHRAVK